MATGDADNVRDRLRSLIPRGWFASLAPMREAVLGGFSDALALCFTFVAYAKAQTRILTASGFWLDLVAWDFFGARFARRKGEPDASFAPRIVKEVLRPRATRASIIAAIEDLTGRTPQFVEPWNPADCGGYGAGVFAYGGTAVNARTVSGYGVTGGGYGAGTFAYVEPTTGSGGFAGAGRYGSLDLPGQMFIDAFRPAMTAVGNIAGYGAPIGGYSQGAIAYLQSDSEEGALSDVHIYETIADTVAAGTIGWTRITS